MNANERAVACTKLRALTHDENGRERKLTDATRDEIDNLCSAIEAYDDSQRRTKTRQQTNGLPANGPVTFRDLKTGRPVRVYGRGVPMSATHPGDQGPLSIGNLLAGVVSGCWEGRETERRALSEGVNVSGGFLVPDPLWSSVVDLARARSVVMRLGGQVVEMPSETLALARLTTDPTIGIVAENATIGESQQVFDRLNLTAHKCGVIVKSSLELWQDAPNIAQIVEASLAQAMARFIDSMALTYISGAEGVQTVTSIGAITWEDLLTATVAIMGANGTPNGYALHPEIMGDLAAIQASTAGTWQGPPPLVSDLTPLASTQLTTATGIVADFSTIVIGTRMQPTIQVSQEPGFASAQVWVRCLWRGDVNAFHASHCAWLSGITT